MSGVNDSFQKDSDAVQIPYGFYTFSSLKKYLNGEGVTIEKTASGNVELTSEKDLNLKKFGKLLGFPENKAITKSQKYVSPLPTDLLNGLAEIEIHCSLVDDSRNFDQNGEPSQLLVSFPVDTEQPLFGSMTRYNFNNVVVPCGHYYGHDIKFDVKSKGGELDYTICLSLRVE